MLPLVVSRRRLLRFHLVIGSLAVVGAVASCGSPAPAAPGPPPPPTVGVSTVALREVSPSDELTGRIEAIHDVEVRPRVSGYVTAVNYREGSEVPRGAALFTIDARPYEAALAHATADFARAQARVDLARADSERAEKLIAESVISKVQHETTTSTTAQANADVQAAKATVDAARLDVDFTEVRAPLPGRTGQALVSVGDYVAAGPAPTLLTTIVTVDPVYVTFTTDEQTFLRFASRALGSPVGVGLGDEPGYPHTGKIDFIDNRVDAATGTIRLRAVVPNGDKRLTPGLYARVQLGEGKAIKAVLVDDKAVLTDQDRKYVYVLGASDAVERRDVKLGRVVDGLRMISEGLQPGDRVIVNGTQKVFPGGKAVAAPVTTAIGGAGQ
jgi:multidrug efflux system membrane fusion protein